MKYVAFLEFGAVGCSGTELIEADSVSEAEEEARELTIEWASSFDYHQDPDYFGGSLDGVGCEWDEETEEYIQEGWIDYYVEEYDPETHDGIL